MDKNVNRTEEQIDWVSQLAPTYINLTPEDWPKTTLVLGSTRSGKTRLQEPVFHPRNLSASTKDGV